MKEVRQTKMPELSPVKPAGGTERRAGERSETGPRRLKIPAPGRWRASDRAS